MIRSFVIFQGIQTTFAKEPYIYSRGGGVRTPCPPPLWIRPGLGYIISDQRLHKLLNVQYTDTLLLTLTISNSKYKL